MCKALRKGRGRGRDRGRKKYLDLQSAGHEQRRRGAGIARIMAGVE